MWAFATNRVHGLGLTGAEFWAMTPRELAAHSGVMERARDFMLAIHASLQATLHNAHFRHKKEDPVFTRDMFMPGYEQPKTSEPAWKRERAAMVAHMQRAKVGNPLNTDEGRAAVTMIDHRMKRAQDAKDRGEAREVIDRIMRGVA